MLTFLHTYKGKNANTIIDDKTYDAIEAIKLIHEAEKAYKQKHSTKNILNIF